MEATSHILMRFEFSEGTIALQQMQKLPTNPSQHQTADQYLCQGDDQLVRASAHHLDLRTRAHTIQSFKNGKKNCALSACTRPHLHAWKLSKILFRHFIQVSYRPQKKTKAASYHTTTNNSANTGCGSRITTLDRLGRSWSRQTGPDVSLQTRLRAHRVAARGCKPRIALARRAATDAHGYMPPTNSNQGMSVPSVATRSPARKAWVHVLCARFFLRIVLGASPLFSALILLNF